MSEQWHSEVMGTQSTDLKSISLTITIPNINTHYYTMVTTVHFESGARLASTSQVCVSAILLLLFTENYEV
jgi:hypothetical protein